MLNLWIHIIFTICLPIRSDVIVQKVGDAERKVLWQTPRTFKILDAETGDPIVAAKLKVVYHAPPLDDLEFCVRSDAAGNATALVSSRCLAQIYLSIEAIGYIPRNSLNFDPQTRPCGVDPITNSVVAVRLYRCPFPKARIVVPNNFKGALLYHCLLQDTGSFVWPPSFPLGKRTWDTSFDSKTNELDLIMPPTLGDYGIDESNVEVTSNQMNLNRPKPGDLSDGSSAWPIGVKQRNGLYDARHYLIYIGTRQEALEIAASELSRHGNTDAGYIYNGWVAVLRPETQLHGFGPFAMTPLSPTLESSHDRR